MSLAISRPQSIYRTRMIPLLGGLNDRLDAEYISPDELSDVRNFEPDLRSSGVLSTRDGITQVSTIQTAAITSIHHGIIDIWATKGTDIINDAGTSQAQTLTAAAGPDWASFEPAAMDIMVNGTDVKKVTSGPTWDNLGGTPPAAKYITVYNNFVFLSGHDEGKVRWSNPGDPETWDADNEHEVYGTARGLATWRNAVYHFTNYGFHQISGTAEKAMQILYSGEPGSTSHRSIVPTPYGLYWWSDDGLICSRDGYSADNITALKVPKFIDSLNYDAFDEVHGCWDPVRQRLQYYLKSAGSSTEDVALFYYPKVGVREIEGVPVGSFWPQSGIAAQMSASASVIVDGRREVYLGSAAANGYIYKINGSSDDSAAIEAYLATMRDATAEHGSTMNKLRERVTLKFIISGTVTGRYSIYLNDSTSETKGWDFTLTPEQGFVLDSSTLGQLDDDVLGAGAVSNDQEFYWNQEWQKSLHYLTVSAAQKMKFAGLIDEGVTESL